MKIRMVEGTFDLANGESFNNTGPPQYVYFMLCQSCDSNLNYYETPRIANQGPFFQVYCKCGELRSFRRLQ